MRLAWVGWLEWGGVNWDIMDRAVLLRCGTEKQLMQQRKPAATEAPQPRSKTSLWDGQEVTEVAGGAPVPLPALSVIHLQAGQ